jgi:hypothetical protein
MDDDNGPMRTDWPEGAEVAVSLTFDVDAESGWLGTDPAYAGRLSTLSEARYGITRGLPRILDILRRHDVRATFYVPGDTAERHTEGLGEVVEAGQRSATTGTCTSAATRSRKPSSVRRSSAAPRRCSGVSGSRRAAIARRPGS